MRPFYRRVFITNFDKIPLDAPVILAANHPTGFVDPLVLSSYVNKQLWHMTRGDLFTKPWAGALLRSGNMFPVFRFREGFENTRRNNEVFDYCTEKLADNQILAIYVEGNSAHEKRLRPLQKGAARIAFAAFETNQQKNLQIIPIGANYTYADEPRSEIMYEAGAPIFVADFFEKYQSNPAAATNELTAAIEARLRELVIIVDKPADDALVEQLHQLYRNPVDQAFAVHFSKNNRRLHDEKAIADHVNQLSGDEITGLASQADAYFSALENAGATDFGLVQPDWASGAWTVLGIVGFLPALVGKMLVWPPAALARWFMKKKARKAEFRSSIEMGVGIVGYWVIWFPAIFMVAFCTKNPVFIAIALLIPLWGYLSMLFFEIMDFREQARAAQNLPENEHKNLLEMREKLTTAAFSTVALRLHQ